MIFVGDKQEFAIAAEITELLGGWLFGKFAFVFHGRFCGNWSDSAHLRGCYGWLKEFAEDPVNRFEPGLMEQSSSEIIRRLILPIFNDSDQPVSEIYENTYSRFHISHLGMSSFDLFRLVLIEDSQFQRCVWQDLSNEEKIYDDIFPHRHMQDIAGTFCEKFEQQLKAMKIDLDFNPNKVNEDRIF